MSRASRFLPSIAVGVAVGCAGFDTTTPSVEQGTLGEEIVRVFCERQASDADPGDVLGLRWKPVCRGEVPPPADAPPRLRALMANRTRLAAALDAVLPEPLHDELGCFLGLLLPLFDPPRERLPQDTRLLAELVDRIAADEAALDALARSGTREGYRPLRLALGVVRPALAYPDFDRFAELALRTLTDLESDPADGLAAAEWRALQTALAFELATLEPSEDPPPGERTTLELTRELMFTVDPAFSDDPTPELTLVRDERGLAMPTAIAPPFVDRDGDGLADIDALGRFVDAAGTPIAIAPPFRVQGETGVSRDAQGRAISGSTPIWQYLDTNRTLLAAIVREAPGLFDPDAPALLDLARGLPAIVGPPIDRTETYGAATLRYRGPDTARSSVVDAVYALSTMLDREPTERALALVERLLRDHEAETAAVVATADLMLSNADEHPSSVLRQPNDFWNDMIDLGIDYAQDPGLIDGVIRALADPRSAEIGRLFGEMMRHRDRVDWNPSDPNGPPIGLPLDEPVDRTMPDVRGNESIFQRTVAVIDALDGVRVCNREGARLNLTINLGPIPIPLRLGPYSECEVIEIDNVAEAYALAIIGEFELELKGDLLNGLLQLAQALGIDIDQALEEASGIDGLTRRPGPEALNRLVFWALDSRPGMTCSPATPAGCNSEFAGQVFAPVLDRHGNDVIETYGGTIFAWEQAGFYEGLRPLVEILMDDRYRYDAQGRFRFGRLIHTLHVHWASEGHWLTQRSDPSAPNFSFQDDARSYEPPLAEGLVDGRLTERFQRLATVARGIQVEPGRDGLRVLAEAAEDLIDPARHPGLLARDGRRAITSNSGARQLAVTPLMLLLDAFDRMDEAFAAEPDRLERWRAGRDALTTQLLDTSPRTGPYQFVNRRGLSIVLTILPFLRDRIAEHRAAGDLSEWSGELVTDTEDLLASPLTAALIAFLDRVQDDPEARDALSRFVGYLVDEASANDAFVSSLLAAADMLMLLEDETATIPLAHALSRALAPDSVEVVAGTDEALDLDGAVATDALGLIREIQGMEVGERDGLTQLCALMAPYRGRVIADILGNLVALPDSGEEVTPLETILEVMGEVGRAQPGSQEVWQAGDYREIMGLTRDFLLDRRRSVERLYDVVQERQVR